MNRAKREPSRSVAVPSIQSIDELQRLRGELVQREQLGVVLEGLLESLTDGTVALDFRGEITHLSDSLREPASAWRNRRVPPLTAAIDDDHGDLLPDDLLERLRREAELIEEGAIRRFEIEWDREDLGHRVYEVVAVAGRSRGVGRLLTVFAFHDRTRLAELESELERSRDLVALGRMAATVAHEIRNPLGAIQGFAGLLRRDLAKQPESAAQVDCILRGVEAANRIVSDLLEFSRPVRIDRGPVSVESLLAESLAVLQISSRWNPALDLDLTIDPKLPACWGDRRLLLQTLGNLYDNAIDAMDGSGRLSIRARLAGGLGPNARIRIVIRDAGCGLTSEEVARVFEPFYTSKPGGTGLGLAIVRRTIEAHEGHVHVVSAPGRGTSVVLELPVSTPARIVDSGAHGDTVSNAAMDPSFEAAEQEAA